MKWTQFVRRLSYKKVPRPQPQDFKIMERPHVIETVPLPLQIDARIQAGGPITVADYMKAVLTNPQTGYYMNRDVFGQKGDFITSPEISQLFGEIIAVWIISELRKLRNPRKPSPLQLIELGPGRGTLLADILRVVKALGPLPRLSVHLVEVSPSLAGLQAQQLCQEVRPQKEGEGEGCYQEGHTREGVHVSWYRRVEEVPKAFSVVLAHEFFDALPIHKFQQTEDGWREVLVTSSRSGSEPEFRYTLSNKETSLSKLLVKEGETRPHVEVCPQAGAIAAHLAERIEEDGGFALFVDYGHCGEKTDTFRAFRKHKLHDPLVQPGSADLTADVDFSLLSTVMSSKLLTLGPVPQGDFLTRLGIETRLAALKTAVSDKEFENLKEGYRMIVDKDQMGERFKVFAAFPKVLEETFNKWPVAGFS